MNTQLLTMKECKMLRAQLYRGIRYIRDEHPFINHPEWNNLALLYQLYSEINDRIKTIEKEYYGK